MSMSWIFYIRLIDIRVWYHLVFTEELQDGIELLNFACDSVGLGLFGGQEDIAILGQMHQKASQVLPYAVAWIPIMDHRQLAPKQHLQGARVGHRRFQLEQGNKFTRGKRKT